MISLFADPFLQPGNLKVLGLLEKGGVEVVVVAVGAVVEDREDAVAEVAQDVLEYAGIGIDEVGSVWLLVTPFPLERVRMSGSCNLHVHRRIPCPSVGEFSWDTTYGEQTGEDGTLLR